MSKSRRPAHKRRSHDRFVCCIPAHMGYMAVIREMVAAAARQHGFSDGDLAQAVMAVDEACVNVVEHAYSGDPAGTQRAIEISVEADAERLVVTIRDEAPRGFSPMGHPAPDLLSCWSSGERPGLGIVILREFMDEVDHKFRPGVGNELRLVKYPSRDRAGAER